MKKGIGLPVFPGVAIGPAVVYRKAQRTLPVSSGDPALEKAKFTAALDTAREQLTALFEKAKVEIGEEQAAIVEVQLLMLDDLDYLDGVNLAIEGGAAAFPRKKIDKLVDFAKTYHAKGLAWAAEKNVCGVSTLRLSDDDIGDDVRENSCGNVAFYPLVLSASLLDVAFLISEGLAVLSIAPLAKGSSAESRRIHSKVVFNLCHRCGRQSD